MNSTNGIAGLAGGGGMRAWLAGWTLVLATVFTVLDAEGMASGRLSLAFLLWCAHVGSGLAVMSAVLGLLQRHLPARTGETTLLVLATLPGVLAFLPVAIALEILLPGGDWLEEARRDGVLNAALEELLNFAPAFACGWLLINIAYVLPRRGPPVVGPGHPAAARPQVPDASAAQPEAHAVLAAAAQTLVDRLAPALGPDVITLEADLNYLKVYTTRGSTLLLYSLQRAVAELGARGLQLHRSHWVATDHVAALRRRAGGYVIVMDDGREVPVSRRRQAQVKAMFGDGFRRADSPAIPPSAGG